MPKRKTSIAIDEDLWKEWTKFVIDKTGSARKTSEEIENALKEYMKRKS
jgi:metal-responsive CopG/Arc/MetJ family transcriptional regulator